MKLVRHHGGWVIALTLIFALMFTLLPLPQWALPYRPELVLLVLIYWAMAVPERVGVGISWGMGLLVDVIRGTLLGQHALAFALVAYITLRLHRRIRVFPIGQQALSIMPLVAVSQSLVLWVKGISGEPPGSWSYWLPTLTSAIIWPWVFLILRDLRRHFRVS